MWQIKKGPLLLYEDGSLEIESIAKFKDYSAGGYRKNWYNGIKERMEDLNNSAIDLRHDFFPMPDDDLTVHDILFVQMPYKKHFSRMELLKLLDKRYIEKIIYYAREDFYKLLNRRMRKIKN